MRQNKIKRFYLKTRGMRKFWLGRCSDQKKELLWLSKRKKKLTCDQSFYRRWSLLSIPSGRSVTIVIMYRLWEWMIFMNVRRAFYSFFVERVIWNTIQGHTWLTVYFEKVFKYDLCWLFRVIQRYIEVFWIYGTRHAIQSFIKYLRLYRSIWIL